MTFNLPVDFYRRYWQREPVVIRSAIANFKCPISADELAGLACMEEVESRIVLEQGGDHPWELRHGPFAESAFAALPDTHWTLLVQAVDHWVEEIAEIRRAFPAIPNWLLDDVMVSYAADGGTVGPHVDQYDVFLLQGSGRRRWRLGGPIDSDAALLDDADVPLLSDFVTASEVLLEPGDALYVPAGHAHWGIAAGECITISIGFRAPAIGEMLDAFAAFAAARLPETVRYRGLECSDGVTAHPGEITRATLAAVYASVLAQFNHTALSHWFGAFVTERKYESPVRAFDETAAKAAIAAGVCCRPCPESRFAFVRHAHGVDLYADGARWECAIAATDLILALCDGVVPAAIDVERHETLMLELLREGCIEFI